MCGSNELSRLNFYVAISEHFVEFASLQNSAHATASPMTCGTQTVPTRLLSPREFRQHRRVRFAREIEAIQLELFIRRVDAVIFQAEAHEQ